MPVLLLSGALCIIGCGASLSSLNQLAARGAIDQNAPVVAHVQMEIAASPARVWSLLVDAPSWPAWQPAIRQVKAVGPLRPGMAFTWDAGGTAIRSSVQLFVPETRLCWTGAAWTAKAIHLWQLKPRGRSTVVAIDESLDGPWMARFYSSRQLAEADAAWLLALKQAAEADPSTASAP